MAPEAFLKMKKKFTPIDTSGVKTYSIKGRTSKVTIDDLASLPKKGGTVADFYKTLPNLLGAKNLNAVVDAIVTAHKADKTVAIGMGAHVIKVGMSPIIIDLMERGVINSVSMNGAGIVHDFELAFAGFTSEDVDSVIEGGEFGMAEETGSMLNDAIKKGADNDMGLGESVGKMINEGDFPNKHLSILAAGERLGVPVTVHVAVGTDIPHVHPSMDGAATGKTTEIDFRIVTSVVASLKDGVFLNIGSAVIIPEVFIKALTLARNLGNDVKNITAVNMDFLQHYRPLTNVVKRPTLGSGKGYALTGHHEIMVPLLYAGIIEAL